MKQIKKRSVLLLLVLILSIGVLSVPANARASEYLNAYYSTLGAQSGGKINVTVYVMGTGMMTKIGATVIVMQKSTDGGSSWSNDKTYFSSDYPSMVSSGITYFDMPITHSGEAGKMYRAIVTCYAGNNSGFDAKTYTTQGIYAKA